MASMFGIAVWAVIAVTSGSAIDARLSFDSEPPLRPYQAFGTREHIGVSGGGTTQVGLEVGRTTRHAEDSTESLAVWQYRDRWIQSTHDLRPSGERRLEIDRLAPGKNGPRAKHQLVEARRTIVIELDGSQVSHRHEGVVGAPKSKRIPAQIAKPVVVDSSFVIGFQLLIDHALTQVDGLSALNGVTINAIVPSKLGTYDFKFETLGSETLKVQGGDRELATLRITRVEPPIASMVGNNSLDERRLFWLTDDGTIVRMDIPRQPRFQGESTTYNLKFRPDYYGTKTERFEIDGEPVLISTRGTVAESLTIERAPAVLFVHDNSEASRSIVASTCWNITRRAMTFASVAVDPSKPADLARAAALVGRLQKHPMVRQDRIVLITAGQALPRGDAWNVSSFSGWALINARADDRTAVDATLGSSEMPILLVWGDEGDGLIARRKFASATRGVVGGRASVVPLAQIDGTLRYVPGVPSAAPKDDFGLAFGYVRGLQRWLDRMTD